LFNFKISESIDEIIFKEIIINCAKLFDTNKDPLMIILDKNTGGSLDVGITILELLTPIFTYRIYNRFRFNSKIENFFINSEGYRKMLLNKDT
jgi:hypothetical protein